MSKYQNFIIKKKFLFICTRVEQIMNDFSKQKSQGRVVGQKALKSRSQLTKIN